MRKELVPCSMKYWEEVRKLRNDPRTKKGFIQQEEITPSQHSNFMKKWHDNFVVCLVDKQFAGYARVIDDDISVAVKPEFQKCGVGKFLIKAIVKNSPSAFAKVKVDNEASLALFESSGFKKKYYILEQE